MRPIDRSRGRRPVPVLLMATMLLAVGLAACGGSVPTAAPSAAAPPVTAAPSGVPTPVPAAASADLTPVPGAGGGEPLGTVVAVNIAFEPPVLTVPAGEPFVLALRNEDAGVPHSLQVNDPNGGAIATSDVVTGAGQATLSVPALQPGSYGLACTIHSNMTATLVVE